jgi:hypothetical protein
MLMFFIGKIKYLLVFVKKSKRGDNITRRWLSLKEKTIIKWKSKVQYKKNLPYIHLIKHLSHKFSLAKGNEVTCELVMIKENLEIRIKI